MRAWIVRQPKVSMAAGAVAGLLLCWAVYLPLCLAIRSESLRRNGLRTEMVQARDLLDLVRQGKVRSLPAQQSLPDLLAQLHVQAKKFQVNILGISPGKADTGSPDRPILLPIELQLEGEYRSIGQFLGSLRAEPSLGMVTVRHLHIGREDRLLPRLHAQLSIDLALQQGAGDET